MALEIGANVGVPEVVEVLAVVLEVAGLVAAVVVAGLDGVVAVG